MTLPKTRTTRLRHCERCGYDWFPRKTGKPRICPRCKSARWDTPKADKAA